MSCYDKKPFIEVAKKFGIEDIDFENNYIVSNKLLGEYVDINATYATMLDNFNLLKQENDTKKTISAYLDIIEYLFTTEDISDEDKKVLLYLSHNNIFTFNWSMIPTGIAYDAMKISYYDDVFDYFIARCENSSIKYLNCLAVCMYLFTFNAWRFNIINPDIINTQLKSKGIEEIAKSINEKYYKPIMVNIIISCLYNMNLGEVDEEYINHLAAEFKDLLFYNRGSNDIYDVLIRAHAFRFMRFNLYKYFGDFIKYMPECKGIPQTLYMYVEENVFYECEAHYDTPYHKKLEDGGYLVFTYYVNAMGYEKEWFDKHPDCDSIYIDETPEFNESINADKFDMAFNSDPTLFEEPMVLYATREEAKAAFMKRVKE